MDILELIKGPFEGFAPLVSAVLTAIIMWRIVDLRAAVQLSAREAKIREYLTAELKTVKEELNKCEENGDADRRKITELETRVRELEWQKSHGGFQEP